MPTRLSFVLVNLASFFAALAIVPLCRAQEVASVAPTVPTVDSKRSQSLPDSAIASAQIESSATFSWNIRDLPSLANVFGPRTGLALVQRVNLSADANEKHPFTGVILSRAARPEATFCAVGARVEVHNCSTVSANTNRQPSSTSLRLPTDVDFTRGNTWKQLYSNVLDDQATVLRYPLEVARGHHWEPFLTVAVATAGLIALDPYDSPYFRRTTTFHGFNTAASGLNTGAAMALVPAAFYVVSAKRSDSYGKETVFLAAQAIADVQIITIAMKMIDRRIRPVDVSDDRYADTWFKAGLFDGKSFPSAHTITAFALADIFSERYKRRRWVPWIGYGLASVVGFSRLTLQSHFPSDVFAGGVLGVVVPHYIVLRR